VTASAFNIEQDSVKETLGKSPTEYKVKMPILKALEEASLLPQAKKGQHITITHPPPDLNSKKGMLTTRIKNITTTKLVKYSISLRCASLKTTSMQSLTQVSLLQHSQGITPRSTAIVNDATYEWI